MDVFLYSGLIERSSDLRFIEFVRENKKSSELILVVATPGGSPDAAYKISKYLQRRYDRFSVFIPGLCKSAGTLLAIAANELIFTYYGELGPLDIKTTKSDNIGGMESGLNISEAFISLESRAKNSFHDIVEEIVNNSGGIISFQTASHSAAEIVASLYGPIFGRIDPEEVGSRARAMRIGHDYGKRLNLKYKNLKQAALTQLVDTYSSHGFVIDIDEARALFLRVREASSIEKALVKNRGMVCRHPTQQLCIDNLTDAYAELMKQEAQDGEAKNAQPNETGPTAKRRGRAGKNGADPARAS